MSSSFSPSLLSSSFNSSTDPKALDFGTLVAIEEVPKPSGFTAGAGAKDASVTGAEATGGAGKVVVSSALSSFFFLFFFFFRTIFIGLVFPTNRPNSDFTVWLFTRGNLSIGISVIHGKASVSSENTKTSCADGAYARCANIVAIIILRKAVSNNKYRLRLF